MVRQIEPERYLKFNLHSQVSGQFLKWLKEREGQSHPSVSVSLRESAGFGGGLLLENEPGVTACRESSECVYLKRHVLFKM